MSPGELNSGDREALEFAMAALGTIARYTDGMEAEAFLDDDRTRAAVERHFITVGKCVKRLSPGFRAAHGDVDWRAVAGFRDVLVHQFDAVLPGLVWEITRRQVPGLRRKLDAILTA